ncbi:uncharacterized protein DDB_G0284459 isoform X2 [Anoplophora glabripennis]|uniref:uncharacterized protein DDB_G0284459 isoform X2 n=1 Tax=Anoplophora glabripennis TaxID=217634 RepID=UPI0008742C81|nr:uncharacterized protein DDB_G0284459 isoform X2 [Anoplophora glabripennis]
METLKSLTGNSFRWSLPCDVNSSVIPARDYQFLEEARRNKAMKNKEYTAIDMESESLLEHDSLAQNYQEQSSPIEMVLPGATKFTTKATLQISGANVDDPIPLDLDSASEKKPYDLHSLQSNVIRSKYNVYIPTYKKDSEEKKVDENGNALQQNPGTKTKKKKIQTDKNVVVLTAESVAGHRSDIIHDVDKLMQYIGGDKENDSSGRTKSNVHKSKQLHKQHTSDDSGRSKKQRAHSPKGKESRSELKKSNSLGEISTAKLEEFAFASGSEKDSENKVVLRPGKGQNDRPKERRSWGTVEPPPIQSLYSNASIENLEAAENWVVTKPKKKSKKRHNSIGGGRRQNSTSESNSKHANRAPSPDLRGKSACSVPHSEKSNDSSDVDSVHSLPIDGLNAPISYADIAKNSEKLKEKKPSPEKTEKVPNKEKSPTVKIEIEPKPEVKVIQQTITNLFVDKHNIVVTPVINNVKNIAPPDVHNIKCFPAISNNNHKTLQVSVEKTNNKTNTVNNKVKNVSCGSKNVNKGTGTNNNNNNVKVSVAVASAAACVVQNDIQNDLSIIHSNEKESIQFNAQMMPPDIPDVQTIEKMHFMNRPPPPHQPAQTQHHLPPPQRPSNPTQLPVPPQVPPPLVVTPTAPPAVPPPVINSTQNVVTNEININSVNCDNSERTISEEDEGPPPVVILSGVGNKEVPGLVFGFDINEQLLNEDICENFISRYIAPEVFSQSSHNHDKIVNFIGSAWEAIVNQSNGKVQYYSEES